MEEKSAEVTKAKTVKVAGNGITKLKRVVANVIRAIFFRTQEAGGIGEVRLDGIFSRIENEKKKISVIMDKQASLISDRKIGAMNERSKTDADVKRMEKSIATMKKDLQKKIEENEVETAKIFLERERGEKIISNINKFYDIS